MESKNRNVWIFVVVAVLVVACCCIAAGAVAVTTRVITWPFQWTVASGTEMARVEQAFNVGEAPDLRIDSFAGSVTVQAGRAGEIRVVATKRVSGVGNLDRIQVDLAQQANGVVVTTRTRPGLNNASVQLEITAPPGTRLDLHTGAGSVEVSGLRSDVKADSGAGSLTLSDLSGAIDAHSGAGSITLRNVSGGIVADSGAGSIEVRGGDGRADLHTGAGSILYEGALQGDSRFESGTGSITLRLPTSLNMRVDLGTGMGTVEVDYAVDGQVTKREVRGVIGTGADGSIYAHTGTGGINLVRR
jgi:DUF4097 and DUF4098 domain-containing protein YvlB